jgi:LEA14-like dessication related protein
MGNLLTAVALSFGMLAVSGCQGLVESVLEKPEVQFHSVAVRDATKDGATAVIAIDVTNPNGVTLTVDELNYALEIGGREVAKAEVKQIARLQAKSTSRVEVPVPFLYSQVFSSVMDLLTKGTAAYKVRGEARVGLFTLPFDHGGELKLR